MTISFAILFVIKINCCVNVIRFYILMIIKSHNDYKVIKRLIGNFIILTFFHFC